MIDAQAIATLRRENARLRRLNDDLIAAMGPMNEVALAAGRPLLTTDPSDIPYPEVGRGWLPTDDRDALPRRRDLETAPAIPNPVCAGAVSAKRRVAA